jgi:hypothetical protein
MRTIGAASTAFLVASVMGGCGAVEVDGHGPVAGLGAGTVMVENHTSRTVRVFAVTAGMEMRIGTVQSMETGMLRLPRESAVGRVQLVARPADGRTELGGGLRTEEIEVLDGYVISWRLRDRPGVVNAPIGTVRVIPRSVARIGTR